MAARKGKRRKPLLSKSKMAAGFRLAKLHLGEGRVGPRWTKPNPAAQPKLTVTCGARWWRVMLWACLIQTFCFQEDFEFDGQASFQNPGSTSESTTPMEGENMGGWWPEFSTPSTGVTPARQLSAGMHSVTCTVGSFSFLWVVCFLHNTMLDYWLFIPRLAW